MSAKGDTQNKYSVVSANIVTITLPAVPARPLKELLQLIFNGRSSQRTACKGGAFVFGTSRIRLKAAIGTR